MIEPHLVEIRKFGDERGLFTKPWAQLSLNSDYSPKEVYVTTSRDRVFRGLHGQAGTSSQAKFVSVISGEIIDFCLDVRTDSDNYGKLYSFELCESDPLGLMVPRGFAHGFYSKGESTIVNFCDNDYDASAEFGFNPLGFDEIVALGELIVSDKDMHQPTFGITS